MKIFPFAKECSRACDTPREIVRQNRLMFQKQSKFRGWTRQVAILILSRLGRQPETGKKGAR